MRSWDDVAPPQVPARRPSAFTPQQVQVPSQGPSKLPVTRTSTAKPSSAGPQKDDSNFDDREDRRRPTSNDRASHYTRKPTRERSRSNDAEQRRGRGRDDSLERHRRSHRKEEKGVGNTRRGSNYGTPGPIGARPSSSNDTAWTRGSTMRNAIGCKHQSPSVDRSRARKGNDHSSSSWGGSWGKSNDDGWGSNAGTQKPIVGVAWSGSRDWKDSGANSGGWEKSSWASHGSGSDWAGREGSWWGGHGGSSSGGRARGDSYEKGACDGSTSWKRRGKDGSWQRRSRSASKSRSPEQPRAAWLPKSSPPIASPSAGAGTIKRSKNFDDGEDIPLPGTTSTAKSTAKPPKALNGTCMAGPSMTPGMKPGLLQPSQVLRPPAKAATPPQPTVQVLKAPIRPLAGQTGLATWDSVARVIPICSTGRQPLLASAAKR